MIDWNLIGNIIGWPIFIIGVLLNLITWLAIWANLTSIKVKVGLEKYSIDLIAFFLILIIPLIGAALIWGIR